MYMYALCWHQRHLTLHAAEDVFHLSQTQAEVMHPHKFKGRLYNLLSVADVTAVFRIEEWYSKKIIIDIVEAHSCID